MYMYNQLYTIGYVCLLFAKSTANTKGAVYTQVLLSLVTWTGWIPTCAHIFSFFFSCFDSETTFLSEVRGLPRADHPSVSRSSPLFSLMHLFAVPGGAVSGRPPSTLRRLRSLPDLRQRSSSRSSSCPPSPPPAPSLAGEVERKERKTTTFYL